MEVPDKEEYLKQLAAFLESAKAKVQSVLDQLGWDEERTCQGLESEDEADAEQGPKDTVDAVQETIDAVETQDVASGSKTFPGPQYNELLSTLMETGKQQEREKTELEKLAEVRDAKRRRATYRNKVHTKNKSHTQVLREVIGQQMTLLTGCVEEKGDVGRPVESEKPDLKEYKPGGRDTNPHLEWKRVIKLEESKDIVNSERRDSREERKPDERNERRHHDERDRRESRDYRKDYYRDNRRDESWRRDYDRSKYSDSQRYRDERSRPLKETSKRDSYPKRSDSLTESNKRARDSKHESKKRSDSHERKRPKTEESYESTRSHSGKKEKKRKEKKKDKKKKKRKRSVSSKHDSSSSEN